MRQLALKLAETFAKLVHRLLIGVELALQHHQADGVAGQFGARPLVIGIEHAHQRLEAHFQVALFAAEHCQRGRRVHLQQAAQRDMQGFFIAYPLVGQLLDQTR
ncbi:hypothetical protein D3C79_660500 [compost metagenome]